MATDTALTPFIVRLARLVPEGCEAYLVGGTVRDLLMGRACTDVDMAVTGDPGELARAVADTMGGTAFVMDEGRGVHRVAFRRGPVSQADISPLKGDIRSDLSGRDFSINAMAVDMKMLRDGQDPRSCPPAGGAGAHDLETDLPLVIDPFGGRDDLNAGLVRMLGPGALIDDPLRMLRAFRLASQLGFRIDEETLSLVGELAGEISRVSPERVRDELYAILSADGTERALRAMHGHGLLLEILPELAPMQGMEQGGPHEFGVLEHSLRAAGHAEAVMDDTVRWFGENAGRVDDYLMEKPDGTAVMRGIVKLCALLHDTGKPGSLKLEGGRPRFFGHADAGAALNAGAAARLRMSDRVKNTLYATAKLHMRPLSMSGEDFTARAVHRLVRDAGENLPAVAVVALADALATRERPDSSTTDVEGLVRRLTDYRYGAYEEHRTKPLASGDDIMEWLGFPPGPLIGGILADIEEKRAEGVLSDKDDAREYVIANAGRFG